jgi:LysM repeat protein
MKTIWPVILTLVFLVPSVRAQDQSVVERVNRLSVYVEELLADRARQQKQIADLTREVESLREQLATPRSEVSQGDMASLADSIREVDKKRQADRELILKEIEKLGKTLSSRPAPAASSRESAPPKGFEYSVQPGDTLSAIVEAYRRQGYKVTVDEVLKANPGLKPTSMQVGQKIIIPQP